MNQNYIIRRAESSKDSGKLRELFAEVFPPPHQVGISAETIFNSFPGMKNEYCRGTPDSQGRPCPCFVSIKSPTTY